jgi:hypothetical protein
MRECDLVGQKFGDLTVIGPAPYELKPGGTKVRRWFCQCTCGRVVAIRHGNLRSLNSSSCGKCGKRGRFTGANVAKKAS